MEVRRVLKGRRNAPAKDPNSISFGSSSTSASITLKDLDSWKYNVPQFEEEYDEEVEQQYYFVLKNLLTLNESLMRQPSVWMSDEGMTVLAEIGQRVTALIDQMYEDDITDCVDQCDSSKKIDGSSGLGITDSEVQGLLALMKKSFISNDSLEVQKIESAISGEIQESPSPFSTPLSRFFKRYVPNAYANHDPIVQSVYEARCEVSVSDTCVPQGIDIKKGWIAITGGIGWKQRDPTVELIKVDNNGKMYPLKGNGSNPITGFYEPGWHVIVDNKRNLVWVQGDERIKAFNLSLNVCQYVLYSGKSSKILLLEIDGEDYIVSSCRGDNILWLWNISQLQQHTKDSSIKDLLDLEGNKGEELEYSELLDLREGSWRDDLSDVETTRGQSHHQTVAVTFGGKEFTLHDIVALPGSGQIAFANEYSIYLMDVKLGKVYKQLLGHTADLECLSVSPQLPNLLATCARDKTAKIWNIQTGLCDITLTGHVRGLYSVSMVLIGGVPFCFTAGADECIKVWDLRQGLCLYELSTGNNHVHSLAWDASINTLFAVTEDMLFDRYEDEEGEGEGEEDIEESEEDDIPWPSSALHSKNDFKQVWDYQDHGVFAYIFLPNPDHSKFRGWG